MLYRPNTILFTTILILSSLTTLSTTNWIILWLSLELNLMAFTPLLITTTHSTSSPNPMKYFLIQSSSSPVLILSIMMMTSNFAPTIGSVFFISSLLMKMGAAPAHFWLPPLTHNLTPSVLFLLLTWQKLAPMMMLSTSMIYPSTYTIVTISLLNGLIGALGGLNQTRIAPLLAYSSIGHMGWMIAATLICPLTVLMYFTTYSLIMLSMMASLTTLNWISAKWLNTLELHLDWNVTSIALLNFISLAGMPPLPGFLPKIMVIYGLLNHNLILILILMFCSLITAYFYFALFFTGMINTHTSPPPQKQSNPLLYMILISMGSGPFLPGFIFLW